jgi:uncharacterized protein YbjT (DUF2867 family)
MPSVLLTGANAFLAAHIINALIRAGYHVTGTVRRAASGDEILSLHPEWQDHLDIVVVEDITDEASWDSVFRGVSFDHVSCLRLDPCSNHFTIALTWSIGCPCCCPAA